MAVGHSPRDAWGGRNSSHAREAAGTTDAEEGKEGGWGKDGTPCGMAVMGCACEWIVSSEVDPDDAYDVVDGGG